MKQRMFNRRYTGSPDKWRINFIFRAVVGLLAGLWISVYPQQLAAYCLAGSFFSPNIINPNFHDVLVFTKNADGSQDNTLEIPSISGGLFMVRDIQILSSG